MFADPFGHSLVDRFRIAALNNRSVVVDPLRYILRFAVSFSLYGQWRREVARDRELVAVFGYEGCQRGAVAESESDQSRPWSFAFESELVVHGHCRDSFETSGRIIGGCDRTHPDAFYLALDYEIMFFAAARQEERYAENKKKYSEMSHFSNGLELFPQK